MPAIHSVKKDLCPCLLQRKYHRFSLLVPSLINGSLEYGLFPRGGFGCLESVMTCGPFAKDGMFGFR